MDLEQFRQHIKTIDNDTLHQYDAELFQKHCKARNPSRKLGYYLAMQEVYCEIKLRKTPVDPGVLEMSDEELLADLLG